MTRANAISTGFDFLLTRRTVDSIVAGINKPIHQRTPTESDNIIKLLASAPLFENLPAAQLRKLSTSLTLSRYEQNDIVVYENDPGDFFYLILSGSFKVIRGGRYAVPEFRHDGGGYGVYGSPRSFKDRLGSGVDSATVLNEQENTDGEQAGPSQATGVPSAAASPDTRACGPTAGDLELEHSPSDGARQPRAKKTSRLRLSELEKTSSKDYELLAPVVEIDLLKPPNTFGELALLDPSAKRAATVYCASPEQAWVVKIGRTCFEQSVKQLVQAENTKRLAALASLQPGAYAFRRWPAERLEKLIRYLHPFSAPAHALLAEAGTTCQQLLFLTVGVVRVLRSRSNGKHKNSRDQPSRAPAQFRFTPRPRRTNLRKLRERPDDFESETATEIGGSSGGGVVGLTELAHHRAAGTSAAQLPVFLHNYVASTRIEGYQISLEDLNRLTDKNTISRLIEAAQTAALFHNERLLAADGCAEPRKLATSAVRRSHALPTASNSQVSKAAGRYGLAVSLKAHGWPSAKARSRMSTDPPRTNRGEARPIPPQRPRPNSARPEAFGSKAVYGRHRFQRPVPPSGRVRPHTTVGKNERSSAQSSASRLLQRRWAHAAR